VTARTPRVVTLTRRNIAKGELDTAILLWFLEKDVASIHVLASAAQEILHAIGGKKTPSLILNWLETEGTKTQRRKRADKTKMSQNFFKHANKDPNYVLDFNPRVSEFIMCDAVLCFNGVFHGLTPLMRIFEARFHFAWRPLLGDLPEAKKRVDELFLESEFGHLSRREFFDKGLALFRPSNA
jgi:hypothetical protein